jgi:hypothetical protein
MRIAAVSLVVAALIVSAARSDPVTVAAATNVIDESPGTVAKNNGDAAGAKPRGGENAAVDAVFRDFDMFGTWAADCGRPATLDNPHVTVSSPNAGSVIENNDLGPDYTANRYSVLGARRLSRERLEATVLFRPGTPDEERQVLIFDMRNGARRTLFNKVIGGEVRVKNGVVLSRGIKTPVLRKCG